MLEVIEIKNPVEQNLALSYGERDIVLEIRWNDVLQYWYFNIKENDEYIATGISGRAVNSNLLYDVYKLGKLYLIDTQQGINSSPILQSDLGNRLALMRDYV